MAFPFNAKFWVATKAQLEDVLFREKLLAHREPTRDRPKVHQLIGNIVASYIILCNNLSDLYDQTLQVQKRAFIEKILVSSTKRLLELQREMQKVDMNEFVYLDDVLIKRRLTPHNVEFLRPFYFPRKREVEAQIVVDEVPKKPEPVEPLKGLNKYRKVLTAEEIEAKRKKDQINRAVSLLKAHEKARQARGHWLNVKLFPKVFCINQPRHQSPAYDFIHQPDQAPLFKIKRTNYEINLQKPKVNVAEFAFYEPPKYQVNRFGKKVIAKEKPVIIVEQVAFVESDDHDNEETGREELELDEIQLKRRETAALTIQRAFRRYQLARAIKRQNIKRMELCGIIEKPEDFEKKTLKLAEEKFRQQRRERKKIFDEKFVQAVEDETARILKFKSGSMMEDITDDIRQWFHEFYSKAKDFHRYPEEFEGGTIMVLRCETKTPEEFLIQKNKSPAQKAQDKALRRQQRKQKKARKKAEAALALKKEEARKKIEQKHGLSWDFGGKTLKTKTFGR